MEKSKSINLLICSMARFGVANVVYNVIKELLDMGVDITYCTTPPNPAPEGCEKVELIDSDRYYKMRETIKRASLYRPIHLLYGNLYPWFKAFRYIKENSSKFDVIWFHNPHPIISYFNKKSINNSIITLHGPLASKVSEDLKGKSKLYYWVVGKMQNSVLKKGGVKKITAVSPTIINQLKETGIDEGKAEYIPNGVDTEEFKPVEDKSELRKKFGIPEDMLVVLSLGRLTEQKNPHKLIEVFSEIEKQLDKVMLVIAGEGELLESTKELARRKELKNVMFLGYVDQEDITDLYACSDYYIMTSKYEGEPLTLFEAMASGLPCIVPELPNLKIVESAKCGIMVDLNTTNEINRIVKNLKNSLTFSDNARKYAERNLSWSKIAEKYYKPILKS